MNDSALISIGLPVALAIIMFGLGLSLEVADFRRVARTPRAVVVALVIQVLVLPVIGLMIAVFFTFGEPRYRVPFDGFLILLSARCWTWNKSRSDGLVPPEPRTEQSAEESATVPPVAVP